MCKFELNILGCGSALPTMRHNPSSQVLNIREKLFMIDCGEGTQLEFRRAKLKFSRLNNIFISHLHGDHCFGLIGLISTLDMLGRTAELNIFSPKGLEDILKPQIDFFNGKMNYKITFHEFETKTSSTIYEDRTITVTTIPLKHRMPCCGFLFKEKSRPNHLNREMCDFYGVPSYMYNQIKNGEDFITDSGEQVDNKRLTTPSAKPLAYAYCSDTAYYPESVLPLVENVDMLFHEATFMQTETARAKQTLHSTAKEAATIAKLAKAKKLIVGHYSARYDDLSPLLEEAKEIFPDTELAEEGMKIIIS